MKRILYIGGTLKVGPNRHYLAKRLGIDGTPLKVIASPYDYEQQARVYVPKDAPAINQVSGQQYVDYLANSLMELITQEKRPILVLFTSHDILQKVYQRIHLIMLEQGREILAQRFWWQSPKTFETVHVIGNECTVWCRQLLGGRSIYLEMRYKS